MITPQLNGLAQGSIFWFCIILVNQQQHCRLVLFKSSSLLRFLRCVWIMLTLSCLLSSSCGNASVASLSAAGEPATPGPDPQPDRKEGAAATAQHWAGCAISSSQSFHTGIRACICPDQFPVVHTRSGSLFLLLTFISTLRFLWHYVIFSASPLFLFPFPVSFPRLLLISTYPPLISSLFISP